VQQVTGNAKINLDVIKKKKIIDFKSWGKQFLICFEGFYIRIHLLMFGSYSINQPKAFKPRLSLKVKNGEINFYNCSVKLIEGDVNSSYNWEADVMSDTWNPERAEKKSKALKNTEITDVLLNQEIFSGAGNIIKNEVLFITKIHPKSIVKFIPLKKMKQLIKEVRTYSFNFYTWKKAFQLRKHWLIYSKTTCPRCKIKAEKEYLGKTKRISYFCNNCQNLFLS